MKVLRDLNAAEKAEFERLYHNKMLREYLETSLNTAKDTLIGIPAGDDFKQVQGQAQVLQHLLNAITPGKR